MALRLRLLQASRLLLVVGLGGACGDDGVGDAALAERIRRVERGLLPAVVVQGEPVQGQTIWEVMERYGVPGVSVAVINDGVLEWAGAYGVREVGGAPVDTATLFLAGHISQAVAALAALRLVDGGTVGLDDDVNDHLVSSRVPDNERTSSEAVTLRRILSHSSGLSVPSLRGYAISDPLPTIAQVLDSIAPAASAPVRVLDIPGSRQRYSLGGYVVLQKMLEDVTGLPYADLARTAVLAPLGMLRSHHSQPLSDSLAANAATGYEPDGRPVEGRWRVYPELAALGMWTTPSDLARLALEVQRSFTGESEHVVSRASAAEMLSQQLENRGLGFEVGGAGEWRFFRLEGHGNNFLSELWAYASHGKGAVVMTNSSNGEGVRSFLMRSIAAEYGWPDHVPEEVEVARLPIGVFAALEGRYSFRGRDRVLTVEGDRILQRQGDRVEELLPLSEDQLVSVSFGYRYDIDRDTTGAVTGLTLVLQGTRLFTYERTD